MIKRRIFLQLFLAVLVIALFAGAAHAITHINFDWPPDYHWTMEELWVVDGPGGPYGVGMPFFFDNYMTVYVGPRTFTVPAGPKKLAAVTGLGLLAMIGFVAAGIYASKKRQPRRG